MPETPMQKERPHPWKARHQSPGAAIRRAIGAGPRYVELQVATNFTFLTGASHPEEYVQRAAELGHDAAAITDCNTVAGIVRAHVAARELGIPLAIGCRIEFEPADDAAPLSVLIYPTDRAAYAGLCELLTRGRRRAEKGECALHLHDLIDFNKELLAALIPPRILDERFLETARGLRRVFDDDRFSLATSCLYGSHDRARLDQLAAASDHVGAPLLATNDVHYHDPKRRPLQDILTCIRHGCTIDEAGFRLFPHGERFLKRPDEMARLFADHPEAIARTVQIARRAARFSLDELKYEYPDESRPAHCSPMDRLRDLTWTGARERYPAGVPERITKQIEHELRLIDELNYAPYFLTVHDVVVHARSEEILCQGRGAAANSAVCYCLGVTAVDPDRIQLLFERFVSKERDEPPDIDIDFEHDRREEVIQHIYEKYGRDRAALTAVVITYRARSAIRDVGKAMGLSLDAVERLSKTLDWWDKGEIRMERVREAGLDPRDPAVRRALILADAIRGFPRHLSQHPGGFVMTRGPLSEYVPIENAAMEDRTVIEWDKDDIDAMGMLKIDVLGLGMLTCVRRCFDMINAWRRADPTRGPLRPLDPDDARPLELHTIPAEDATVYDMICAADTIGVFQIESRAQMQMLPRLRPRTFYDLVIEVAIVRPGPIQGKMVHPYLRRRNGEEPVEHPDARVEQILGRTLGVPLFQEQAMSLAIHCAGFTPGEADQLRRAIAAWKTKQKVIYKFGQRIIEGMAARGYDRQFAERCFEQIKGFSEYGFPESHAASFALIVYISAWLKKHHPAAFAAALINSQPMGFYAPAQIARDASEHGVDVRPVDVNHSAWDCTLEDCHDSAKRRTALRLGMRLVKGLSEEDARRIERVNASRRDRAPFTTIEGLRRASGATVSGLRRLAAADAFQSMNIDRQRALWEIRALRDDPLEMYDAHDAARPYQPGEQLRLPLIDPPKQVALDYRSTGLSLKAHPISFVRDRLDRMGVTPARELADESKWRHGKWIQVGGIVLVRQRPGTASGVVFITLEDETGVANLIIRPKIYQRDRKAARHAVILLAQGTVERQGQVVHIMTREVRDLSDMLDALPSGSRDFH